MAALNYLVGFAGGLMATCASVCMVEREWAAAAIFGFGAAVSLLRIFV